MKSRQEIEENINKLIEKHDDTAGSYNTVNMQIKLDTLRALLDIRDLLQKEEKGKDCVYCTDGVIAEPKLCEKHWEEKKVDFIPPN